MTMPNCIQCKSKMFVHHDRDRNYYCTFCKIGFDDDPDEGGDYSNNPTMHIQREEERSRKRREKARRR